MAAKPKVWSTAITIAYLNRMAGSHQSAWQEKYEAAKKYLSSQIGDAQAEEILKVSDQIVVEKVTRKAVTNTAAAVETVVIKEKAEGAQQKGESIFSRLSRVVTQGGDIAKHVAKGTGEAALLTAALGGTAVIYGAETLKDVATTSATAVGEGIKKGEETMKDVAITSTTTVERGIKQGGETLTETGKDVGGWISGLFTWKSKDKQDEVLKQIESKTTVETTTTIIKEQNEDGSINLSDVVATELDVSSSETLIAEVDKYKVSEKLKAVKPVVWTTAITIAYLKRMAGSHQSAWQEKYEAAKKYLSSQIGDAQAEEILKVSDQLVVEKVTQKAVIDKAAKSEETQKAILDEIQTKTTIETTTTIIKEQNEDGSIGLSDVVATELDVSSSETLITEVDKYKVSDKLKMAAKPKVWSTAITIAYLNRMAGPHQSAWQEKYEAAKKYLTSQIGDSQTEEILKVSDQIVVEKVTRKAVTQRQPILAKSGVVIHQVEYNPDIPRVDLEEPVDITQVNHQVVLNLLQTTVREEDVKGLISSQNEDGSFGIHNEICSTLHISEESLMNTINSYSPSDKLQQSAERSWWTTALTLTYLKNIATDHQVLWQEKFDQAQQYLKAKINDANLEAELWQVCDKLVTEESVKKALVTSKRIQITPELEEEALNSLRISMSVEIQTLISTQKQDGSFTLHETILKHLRILDENAAVIAIKRHVQNQSYDNSVWITALTIAYLQSIHQEHEAHWRLGRDRALAWLRTQVNDVELEEILEAARRYVVELAVSIHTSKISVHHEAVQDEQVIKTHLVHTETITINSEHLVVGAAYEAIRKYKIERADDKDQKPYDIKAAYERVETLAKKEIGRLFTSKKIVTDQSLEKRITERAATAAKFLIDEYYNPNESCSACCSPHCNV